MAAPLSADRWFPELAYSTGLCPESMVVLPPGQIRPLRVTQEGEERIGLSVREQSREKPGRECIKTKPTLQVAQSFLWQPKQTKDSQVLVESFTSIFSLIQHFSLIQQTNKGKGLPCLQVRGQLAQKKLLTTVSGFL